MKTITYERSHCLLLCACLLRQIFSVFPYVAHAVLFKEAVHIAWQLLRRPGGRRSCHGQVEAEDTTLDPRRGVKKLDLDTT